MNVSSTAGGYEWTCPICGKTRLNSMRSSGGAKNAMSALRTHISASEDPEHGPRNEFPAEFETLALEEYVVEVDGED